MIHERDQGGDAPKAKHSLGEILVDARPQTLGERLVGFARSSPVIVIALSLHVVIGGALALIGFESSADRSPTSLSLTSKIRNEEAAPLIDEVVKDDRSQEFEIRAIAEDVLAKFDDSVTWDSPELIVNPYATDPTEQQGLPEGGCGESRDWTLSTGGVGVAGAIGIGGGSGPGGGGIPKGRPDGGKTSSLSGRVPSNRPPGLDPPLLNGLAWLKRHQSPDGSWDPVSYSQMCDSNLGAVCVGRGSGVHTSGITGLAVLAFLGAGFDSVRQSPYTECVKKGLKWLKQNQDAEGCFGLRSNPRFTYSHAVATLAMCEAYSMSRQLAWKRCAIDGLRFVSECQNPYKAWRYGMKPGDNDTSVTGWMLMAMKAGKDAGLPVDERGMLDGLAFIDSLTDEETGRTGYVQKGGGCVRPEGSEAKWPAGETEALTAVAMCSRIFCGKADGQPAMMKAGAELLSKRLPNWDEARGSIDMYYWYYGTLAMFQVGGPGWEQWNRAMKPIVVDLQIKEGCTKGSWEPKDPWCEDGGRIYATALMTMCLEVYYRYPRVFGAKR